VPSPKPGPGPEPLGRQIAVAGRAARSLLDDVLAEGGITFSSWTVLVALNARGPAIQKDLAKSLDMIGPSVVERIDRLESAGLVIRSPVPEDRRASLVSLTDQGKAVYARLHEVMRAVNDALLDGLDDKDIQATRRVLSYITERAKALRAKRSG
jgi:MarR family transcriptional regulator, transcriptional regulator for hemolysin